MATQFIDNNKDFESLDNWNGFDGIVTSDTFSCLHLSQTNANYTNYIELQENTTYTLWCEIKTTYTQYTYSNRGLLFDSYVVDSNGNEIDESGIDSWDIVSNSTLDANEWRVIELRINTIEFEEDSDYSSIMLRPKFVFTNDETNGIDIYIKNVSLEDGDRRYFGENLLEDTATLSNGMFNVGTLENTGYRYYGGYIYQTTTSLTDGIFCKLDDLLAKKILRYGDLLKFSIYVKSTLEETIETSFTLSPFSLYEETLLNDLWQRIEIEFTWSNAYENLVSNGIALYLRSTLDLEDTDTIYYALPMLEILGDNADKTDEQWIPNSNDEIYNDYMKALIMSYGRGAKGLSVYLYKNGETTYTDLTEKITSYKEDDSSSSTDSFTLGSIGSKNISMTVINYDDNGDELLPRDLTNYYIDIHKSFENIYDDSGNIYVDEEQFRIYENPESFSKSMSLEFQDRMAELSTSYDSKLYYPDITEDEETTDEDTESEETEKTDINNLFSQLNYLSKAQGGATIINNSNGSFTISGSGTLTENYSNIYEYNGDTASEMITEGTLILSVESATTPYLKVSIYGVNTVYPEETEDEEVEEDEDTEYDDTEYDDTEEEIVYETVTTLLAEMTTKESNEVQLVIDETYNDNESFIIEVGFYGESGDTIIEGTIAPKLYYYVEETTDEDTESEETTQEIIETTLPTGETGTWEVVLKYSDGTIISSTLMQSPTIKEQLEEIASSSNMEIDYSDIDESILNEYISFYDSTYSKRQYLGWIAEKSSCNVFVRGNTIIFEKININDLKEQYIDYFSTDMYVGDTFLIGRVCYDNGLEYYNKSIDLLNNDSGTYQLTASEDLETLSLSLDTGHVVTLTSGNKYTFEFESNQSIGYTDGTVGAILYSSDDTQYNINVWASPTVFTCSHSGDYTLMFVFIASEIGSYATFSNFYLTEGEYSYTQLLGDTTYNTYYVDTTNMYITSQIDIDNIYDDLYKMEITGITGAKAIVGNANVRSTDLLKLRFIDELANKDEKKVPLITYIAKHELTYNAEYSSSFECPVKSSNSENAESTTEESGTNTRIRKLSVSVDKTNLEMTVLAQQQTDLETKQSQFKLSLDQIAMSVSSLSDYTQSTYATKTELESSISISEGEILGTVSSTYYTSSKVDDLLTGYTTQDDVTKTIESYIKVSEGKISFVVSENTYEVYTDSSTDELLTNFATSETMKSSIIQTVSEIEISANQISLEGYTTINGNFSIDEEGNVSVNGNITATSGTIGGFTINETNLTGTVNVGDRGETILGEVGTVLLDPENSKITITDSYTTDESDTILDATTLDSGGITVTWSKNGSTNYYSGNYTYITLNNTGLLVKTGVGAEIELTNIDNNANLILGTEYAYGSLGTLSAESSSICLYSKGDLCLQSKTTIYLEANFVISDCSIIVTTSSTTSATDGYQGTYIQNGSIELSHSTPYIDFHYGKSTSDYTSRIIARSSTVLGVTSHIATGSKTGSSDGTTGLLLTNTGNIHLTSDSIPYIYFYYANATSASSYIGAISASVIRTNDSFTISSASKASYNDGNAGVYLSSGGYIHITNTSTAGIQFYPSSATGFYGSLNSTTSYVGLSFATTPGATATYARLNASYLYTNVGLRVGNAKWICSVDSDGTGVEYIAETTGDFLYLGSVSNSTQTRVRAGTNVIIQSNSGYTTYILPYTSLSTSNTGVVFQICSNNSTGQTTTSAAEVILCGGCDGTSPYIRSYATYARTGSSAANVNVTSSGTFNRYSSSSYRYKNTINYLTNEEYASNDALSKSEKTISDDSFREKMREILKLPVVQFHYNEGYMTGELDYDYTQYEVGLIAEDVYKNVPDATQYNEDGTIEMWNVYKIVPRMLFVLQEHEVNLSNYDERLMNLEDENLELRERILVLEETIEKLNAS